MINIFKILLEHLYSALDYMFDAPLLEIEEDVFPPAFFKDIQMYLLKKNILLTEGTPNYILKLTYQFLLLTITTLYL